MGWQLVGITPNSIAYLKRQTADPAQGTRSYDASLPISLRRFPFFTPTETINVICVFVERRLVDHCRITDPLSELSIWHTHPAGRKSDHARLQFSQR
jgi:hypothetical protein